ncbi:GLPGLI family protein [Vaginella massiliensis]|uniref:GLPGLI family protein n=1 Tax=Vaginella massiliensis TaxID=1816680 RepID=UPI0037515DDA
MKKFTILFIILTLSFENSYSQVIEYNFKNVNSILKYELILNENGDSEWRMIVNAKGDTIDDEDFSKSIFKYNNLYYLTEKTISKQLEVVDNPKMIWKKDNSKKMIILGQECLTATTNFRGRNYIAYYTKNNVYKIGPWKFNGLDGIILKIQSDDGMYLFEATNIKLDEKKFNLDKLNNFVKQNNFHNWTEFEKIYLIDIKNYISEEKCNCEDDGKNVLKLSKIEKIDPELHDEGIVF